MTLTVGSLFSGIGGFDLGLERAGMKVIWQSEIETFASRVLKKHWPDVPNLGDITKVDWSKVERPNVICGGYPCQPFSQAGKRGGANDARHLWPAMHNAICVLRPRYALMENVRGHLSLGFGRVLGDLAEIGYDAEWQVIPAAAVGAPHKRDRVFIVAYANNSKLGDDNNRRSNQVTNATRSKVFVTHSSSGSARRTNSDWLSEPDVGRVANGIPNRVDRLKGLGNAIVPQVAELVGALVVEHSQN
jgi:DNA (cytosine-5)-methyltransferase 1